MGKKELYEAGDGRVGDLPAALAAKNKEADLPIDLLERRDCLTAGAGGRPGINFFEVLQLPFGFVLGDAVAFLNFAQDLVALAGCFVKIVVGKSSPLLPDFAFQL